VVSSTTANYVTRIETSRQGMRDLGYIEGKNITVEYRYAEGKEDRMLRDCGRVRESKG
jgi:hypothetical protein